jgi:hypothetical protein
VLPVMVAPSRWSAICGCLTRRGVAAGARRCVAPLLEPLQGIDEAEPAHKLLVSAPLGAQPSADRLPVEPQLELHPQQNLLIRDGFVVHRAGPYARFAATASGRSLISVPEVGGPTALGLWAAASHCISETSESRS